MSNVTSVTSVCFSINKSFPAQLMVHAQGKVNSSGWRNGGLVVREYVVQPEDGIQDLDFVAEAPTGMVLWVICPITGEITIPLLSWMKGVRVHGASNSLVALLSQVSCTVGQGDFNDLLGRLNGGVVDGSSQPRLPGGNGNANGRPG